MVNLQPRARNLCCLVLQGVELSGAEMLNTNEGIDTIYGFSATTELIQVSPAGFGGGLLSG